MGKLKGYIRLIMAVAVFTATSVMAAAQVSFGLFAEDGLVLEILGPDELRFGEVFSTEQTIEITLNDSNSDKVVPIAIHGIAYLDVTVTLTAPTALVLEGDPSQSIPFNSYMAYSNTGLQDEYEAQLAAIPVTGDMITFQIRQRPGGPPGPPPTPPHAGYTPPSGTAYVFVYGDINVENAFSGTYRGEIIIEAVYSTFD